jgi:diadenosine tetraphosphate (Ap4A) HIT family hydrolase
MSQSSFGCALCAQDGGALVWHSAKLRVVHVGEDGFPGYYRVIWNAHVAELSQLSDEERTECMDAVVCVERALIEHLAPAKVNLAALGNQVPHLHWHVIARLTGTRTSRTPSGANPSAPETKTRRRRFARTSTPSTRRYGGIWQRVRRRKRIDRQRGRLRWCDGHMQARQG